MLETSARLLRLLSLLQTRRDWPGPELATRLGVTTRTVRKDVDRLRTLGYPVDATPGSTGGYRLGIGAVLPPLLLDDDEAVAVAVGLRAAAGGSVTGMEETSVRALTKVEQVLPSRLRRRVKTLQAYTVPVPSSGPSVSADVLATLAAVCRDHERLRFDYPDGAGGQTRHTVEPHRLAYDRGRWYLVAWDVELADWRMFQADGIVPRVPTGPRFAPREPPEGGVAHYVEHSVAQSTWHYRGRVLVHASADVVGQRLPPTAGVLTPVDEHSCYLDAGSDDPGMMLLYVAMLDLDFTVEDPRMAERARQLAARFARAAGGPEALA